MLSMMLSISSAGTIWRMVFSTTSHSRATSSIRVPVLARTCRINWPLSVFGKKSCPSHGTNRNAETQISRNTGMKI